MSRMLVEAVSLTRGIPHNPKCVLIALAAHARHDGSQARPSQQTIGELMDMSERSVRNGLTWLKQRGYIIPIRRGFEGGNHTVEYQLSLAMLSPRGVPFEETDNPARGAGSPADNVARDAGLDSAIRQNRHDNPAKSAANPANIARNPARGAAESGKNQKKESKERESAERALGASASFASSFEKENEEPEAEPEDITNWTAAWWAATSGGKNLYAPFSDEECCHFIQAEISDESCWNERAVLYALWLGAEIDADGPYRAWGKYVSIFLESGATPREIEVGYTLMRQYFEGAEHTPGVPMLATHWDEWRAKAKLQIAKERAEEAYREESRRRHQIYEEAEEREREIRATEKARRDALTPEERAAEDAEHTRQEEEARAIRERLHAERMAYMRAKTAPRAEVS